jgi:hypothetical protein
VAIRRSSTMGWPDDLSKSDSERANERGQEIGSSTNSFDRWVAELSSGLLDSEEEQNAFRAGLENADAQRERND